MPDGKIEDTGPLTTKRMETIDDETTAAAIDFMERQVKAGKPFFTWMNTTRMHVFTHVRESMRGQSGMPGNEYADGMIEQDGDVGKLLKALDDLGIANNTIVVYTTDNGPNQFSWPDAATTPFRSEKDSNWEGAFRVPAMVRWPGHIKAGQVSNEMFSGLDWFPTLLAAAGDADVKDRLLEGQAIGGNDLQGASRRLQPAADYLTGKRPKSARTSSPTSTTTASWSPTGYDDWKAVFCEQRSPGGFAVWYEPFDCLRIPKIFNLRMDPYERADIVSDQYDDWRVKNAYLMGWLTLAGRRVPARPSSTTRRASRRRASPSIRSRTRWRRRSRRRRPPWASRQPSPIRWRTSASTECAGADPGSAPAAPSGQTFISRRRPCSALVEAFSTRPAGCGAMLTARHPLPSQAFAATITSRLSGSIVPSAAKSWIRGSIGRRPRPTASGDDAPAPPRLHRAGPRERAPCRFSNKTPWLAGAAITASSSESQVDRSETSISSGKSHQFLVE